MFSIKDLVRPKSIEEAYDILRNKRNNSILGGCTFLRLGSKRIGTAIDLSNLELAFISEQNGFIEIGAMTTLRELEVSPLIASNFGGVISKAASNIIGVQFRNIATVGASIFAQYGFSDLITTLLVLETEVELFKDGRMPLEEFLQRPRKKDILTRILINKDARLASYQAMRKSASDFPLLNVAVSSIENRWTVAVGARPGKAAIAHHASKTLSDTTEFGNLDTIAKMVAEELPFGTNASGSAQYRKAVCKTLVTRAITEVLQCK